MIDNSTAFTDFALGQQLKYRKVIVQILVTVFIFINVLLIITFFKKDCFRTTARYILFAVILMIDSLMLLLSDVLYVLFYYQVTTNVWLCIIICTLLLLSLFITPVTLTAMTLERYVAICMPLRHGELCSSRRTMFYVFIIPSISSIPFVIIVFIFFSYVSDSFQKKHRLCSLGIFFLHIWQRHLWAALCQFYFLIMCIIIVFCYVKIMKVAKAASGEDKNSTHKGLRTVVLHTFQLLLSLIQLWCPFIEAALLQIDFRLYVNIRYFNYIMFSLAPRCLSSLVYGLRDEAFFDALKSMLCFCFKNMNQPLTVVGNFTPKNADLK